LIVMPKYMESPLGRACPVSFVYLRVLFGY
jgi:hypothetical protein